MGSGLVTLAVALQLALAQPHPETGRVVGPAASWCTGEYADSFDALSPAARLYEQGKPPFTFAVRSSAVYECLSYNADGSVRRSRRSVSAHGTAFAYRRQGEGTLLLTNQHVSEWPAVSSDDTPVEGVPAGCKRVAEAVRIVDDDDDAYEKDDVPLARVVSDATLDVAVLRAAQALPVMPWKVGRSALLRERNVVDVRGFPLGALRANNAGKVVSAYDRDEYKQWSHDDFVIDALLSTGNSGSPVFAIRCATGEFELVGVFHAMYSRGSALNVVVGIDQVRDLMTELTRAPRRETAEAGPQLDGEARRTLAAAVRATRTRLLPFGGATAALHARADGALLFEVFPTDFPRRTHTVLLLEDLQSADPARFGELGRVWCGNERGLKELGRQGAEAEDQATLAKLLQGLRQAALATYAFRDTLVGAGDSRASFERKARAERHLARLQDAHRDEREAAVALAEDCGPQAKETSEDPGAPFGSAGVPTAGAPADDPVSLPAHGAAAILGGPPKQPPPAPPRSKP